MWPRGCAVGLVPERYSFRAPWRRRWTRAHRRPPGPSPSRSQLPSCNCRVMNCVAVAHRSTYGAYRPVSASNCKAPQSRLSGALPDHLIATVRWQAGRLAHLRFVFERQRDARAVGDDFAAIDFQVELDDFSHAQITQRLGCGFDGSFGRLLPRYRAGSDDLGDAIDAR